MTTPIVTQTAISGISVREDGLAALIKGSGLKEFGTKARSCGAFNNDSEKGAILYRNSDKAGLSKTVPYGEWSSVRKFNNLYDDPNNSWHDATSSILIAPFTVVMLYKGENYTEGGVVLVNNRAACATNANTFVTMGIQDSVDSVKVMRITPDLKTQYRLCLSESKFENGIYNTGNPACKDAIPFDYCVTNAGVFENDNCRSWCNVNTDKCDAMVAKWCGLPQNAQKPLCSCQTSKMQPAPHILDPQCQMHGYVNTTMKGITSVNYLDCRTQLDLHNKAGKIGNNKFEVSQNCSLTANAGGASVTTKAPGGTTQAPGGTTQDLKDDASAWVRTHWAPLLAAACVAVASVVLLATRRSAPHH